MIFFTAFIQVFLVSINVYFIGRVNYVGMALASLLLNIVWMHNINSIAKRKSYLYPLGAMTGCVAGVYIGRLLC